MLKLPRRKFLAMAAGAAALPEVSRSAWAQAYPTRPVRVVVGFPAGQAVDTLVRLIRFGVPPALPGGPKSLTIPGVWTWARHQ